MSHILETGTKIHICSGITHFFPAPNNKPLAMKNVKRVILGRNLYTHLRTHITSHTPHHTTPHHTHTHTHNYSDTQ
jgi:hypothetical protein